MTAALLLAWIFLAQTPRAAPLPRGVIEGRLVSTQGTPLTAARVTAVSAETVGGTGDSMIASLAQTDSSGRFRLEDVPPGRYHIAAGPFDEPVFFPGTRSRDAANVVTVGPGATVVGIDFVLDSTQIPPRRVTGRLLMEGPLPQQMAGQRLTITLANNRQQGRATVEADGSFEIPSLRGGEYTARLDPGIPITPGTVTIDDRDAPLEFRAPAVHEVAGNVVVEGGGPMPPFSLAFTGAMNGNAQRSPGGGFRAALVAGEYSVVLGSLMPGFFLKSVRTVPDGEDSQRMIVTGAHSQVTVTLGVSSPPPWRTVRGRVAGLGTSAGKMLIALTNPANNNVPPAMANSPAAVVNYVRAVEAAKAEGLTVQLKPDGSFEFPRVLPGNYNTRIALIASPEFLVRQPEVQAIVVSDRDLETELSVPLGAVAVTREIPARVTVEGNGPLPRVTIRRPSSGAMSIVTPRPDGVLNLPAAFGDVSVYVGEMPAGYSLKSLTHGATDLLRNPTAAIDGMSGELHVMLAPSGPNAWVKVDGRVVGLEPGFSARLLLTPTSAGPLTPGPPFPAFSLPALAKLVHLSIAAPAAVSIAIKPDGTFEIPAVLQGNYRLSVSVRFADGSARLDTSTTLTVGAKELAGVEVRIPPLSAARGQVVAEVGDLPQDSTAAAPAVAPAGAPGPGLTLVPSPMSGVSLISFDSAKVDGRFVALFRTHGRDWSYLRRCVAVIANDTPQRIRALTLAWAWTDAAGRTTTRFTSDSDYFFSANSEVVSALSQTLVFPSGVLPGMALNASLGAELRLPARSLVEELGRAVKVTVEVDVAVFEDGRVLGPDHSRTVLNLQARDAAARAYVRRLRAAADNGEDANTVLASLAELAPPLALEGVWQDQLNASTKIGDKDLERFWIARLARAEQQTPTVAFGADRMAKTPPLPAFLRVPN